MAYCRNCGNQIDDRAAHCPYCGVAQAPQAPQAPQYNQAPQYGNPAPANDDKGGFGWNLLGCCIPLVGLILFLVWKDSKPNNAKAAGIGALVGVGINVVCSILSMVLGIAASGF